MSALIIHNLLYETTLLSFFAIAILALTSCDKKDDDTSPKPPPDVTPTQINLVGTYKPVKVVSMQNADITSEGYRIAKKIIYSN